MDAIIRKRVYGAVGIGFVPVPLVDFLGLSALQIELIHALAKAHGVEFKKERVKSIIFFAVRRPADHGECAAGRFAAEKYSGHWLMLARRPSASWAARHLRPW